MKKTLITFLIFIMTSSVIYGQDKLEQIADSILTEATEIYKLEKSLWTSIDSLKSNYPRKYFKKVIDGYVSYIKNDTVITIFWTEEKEEVIIKNTFYFENSRFLKDYSHNHKDRKPSSDETKLIDVKKSMVQYLKDHILSPKPEAARYNIILQKEENGFLVYLILDFKKKTLVPFGNDYILMLDENGKVSTRKRLHQSFLKIPFSGPNSYKGYSIKEVYHSHLPNSPFITVTDIAIAMLYSDYVPWESLVIVAEYLSTYNLKEHTLLIKEMESDK